MTLNYLTEFTPDQLASEHKAFGDRFPTPASPTVFHHERIRVGFVSPDFKSHSCAWFMEPLLQHLDRSCFDIFLYHSHPNTDLISDRFRQLSSVWRHIAGLPSDAIIQRIREDEIDVLVDLAGHSAFNMLEVFARKPAAVQITYLGYPNTTGLHSMDFRFVDEVTDPKPVADPWHTETLVRFAPTAWTYSPPKDAPECVPPPSSKGAPFTFASFNNFQKVTNECLHEWAQLIHEVPGSRLIIKSRGLLTPEINRDVLARLDKAGFAAGEVVILDAVHSTAEHLALYNQVDVALDTHPYNGTTTTCEALWMGIPVISLEGTRHASRVGTSLLRAIGHPDWVAQNWNDYRSIARRFVAAPALLMEIRSRLRTEMTQSPLLDHKGQASRFGLALADCWARVTGCTPVKSPTPS